MSPTSFRTAPSRPLPRERATPPLRVETLGGFRVSVRGHLLGFGRKAPQRPLELLKYLAVHGGRPLPDAQVAGALWPGKKVPSALQCLAVILHRLRRILGESAALVHGQGSIAIDPRWTWCDAVAFESLLERAARPRSDTEKLRLTARAMALYRGDFLAGEDRQAWISPVRERLRERFVLACAMQGERLAAAARWEEARACFQRGHDADADAEDLWLGLMACHAALRQPLTAATAYRRFAQARANRLGANL